MVREGLCCLPMLNGLNWLHGTNSTWPHRQIIIADISKVQTSCGFSVPLYDYQVKETMPIEWAEKKGKDGLQQYMKDKNRISLDGLPTAIF
jgi:glycine cleavage system protein P-like pyridoxal-binding family